jgi:hypothetical protein
MEIFSKRLTHTDKSSLAVLSFHDFSTPFGCIIEDPPRLVKVSGKTRIPAGRYRLGIRKEDTPLTLKHRESKYYKGWFEYHIEVLDVPDFAGIYFHMVNNHKHTDGCQGGSRHIHVDDGQWVASNSTEMIKEFYEIVYPILEDGKEEVWYTIIDE